MPDATAPVYLVRGDDGGLVNEAVKELLHDIVGDEDMASAVEELGSESIDGDAVVEACQTPAFLTSRRVVLVRDAGRLRADDVATIRPYLNDPLPTTVLVLAAGDSQVSAKLIDAVKKSGHVLEAGVPAAKKGRIQWIKERLRESDLTFDSDATDALVAHLGEDVGRLPSLLEAMRTAYGERARVSTLELAPFLGEAGAVAPWDLTDAIDRGDVATALSHLHRMLGAGDRHPLVVMATLHRHFGAMLRLDGAGVTNEGEAAGLLGMAPFPAKKALLQSRKLGSPAVGRAVNLLAGADLDLRGDTAWPSELVLEVLVARLCRLKSHVRASR